MIHSFDKVETKDQEPSLINLDSFLSKFNSMEGENLTLKDLLTFDICDFDKIRQKLEEFQKVSDILKDKELSVFFSEKIKVVLQ